MAQMKIQTGIVSYCINCGNEFAQKEPAPNAVNNIIVCGDENDEFNNGCGTKFICKVVEE